MWEEEGVQAGMGEESDAGVEERQGRERHRSWTGSQPGRQGNESLDGPRRAVRGAGVPEGRGGRVSVRAWSCQPGGAWVSAAPRRLRGRGETAAGRRADGWASALGSRWVGGDVDTLNLRSPFLPEVEFFVCLLVLFLFGEVQGEGRPLLHSR